MDYLSQYTGAEIEAALNSRISFMDVTGYFAEYGGEMDLEQSKCDEINAVIQDSVNNGKLLVFKDGDDVFPLYNFGGMVGAYTQISIGDDNEESSRTIQVSYLVGNGKTYKYTQQPNAGYYGDGTWFRHNKVDFAENNNPMGGNAGWFRLLFDLSPIMGAEADEGPVPDGFDSSFYSAREFETDGPPPILFLGNNNPTKKKFATGVCQWSTYNGGVSIIIPYRKKRNEYGMGYGGEIFSEREYRIWIDYQGLSSEDSYKREDKVVRLRLDYPDIGSSSSSAAIKGWLAGHYVQGNTFGDSAHYVLTEIANGINDGCEILVRSSDGGSSTVWYGKDVIISSDSVTVDLSGIYVEGNSVTARELIISDLYNKETYEWTFVCQERKGTISVTDF